MNLQQIKAHTPDFLKVPYWFTGIIPYSWRYGRIFRETYEFLEESQWWSEEEVKAYQLCQLKRLFEHAYNNVAYYRELFSKLGFEPLAITQLEDIRQLPFLTKDDLRDNLPRLVASNIPPRKLAYATTGGSTGEPVGFYQIRGDTEQREQGFMKSQWARVGYQLGDTRAVLRGHIIGERRDGMHWKYLAKHKLLMLSSYHLTPDEMPVFAEQMNRFKVKFLQAYPSTATIFAKFVSQEGVRFPHLKGLLCGSENIYHWQRRQLEEAFGCGVYSWYGHTEKALLGGECEHSSAYHFFPEYGYLELVDAQGDPISEEGEIGELVGTGFINYATPFIRYRTGDMGVLSKKRCVCGRNYPLLERIEGRLQELIVTGTGQLITLTALIFAQHFEAFSKIKKIQLVQEKPGTVILKIVKMPGYSNADEHEILSKMQQAVSGELDMRFSYVDDISSTKRGKHRFLIQKLDLWNN